MARKTHGEYVAEVKQMNPNIEVVGEYINAKTKILHRCLIDGYEWYVQPNSILHGYGCPKCAGNAKKTTREYAAELQEKNLDIEVIGSYKGANIAIPHRCKIDGYIWKARPAQILSGTGCPKCAGNLKMTQEEYVTKLESLNSDIEVIGTYINARTPIEHRCKIHNIIWKAQPCSILQGTGCPECGKIKSCNTRRKTHDEYVFELSKINPNIVVLDEYKNANTPILHKCLLDGYEWMVTPSNLLRGHGCPKCAGSIKRTQDEYIAEVARCNPDIVVIGEYVNANTPILHKCMNHDIVWNAIPSSILRGSGCHLCSREKIGATNRKTHDKYVLELKVAHPDIDVVGNYVDAVTPIMHRCKKDGYTWEATPASILHGCGCPKCAGNIKRTREQYIQELSQVNPNVELIGDYINANTKTEHHCLIHDVYWETIPTTALQGGGCPICHRERSGKARLKTQEQYVAEVNEINPDIEVIGEYQGAGEPIQHKCLICGNIWYTTPTSILIGNGCPKCNESSGERIIRQWLESHEIDYEFQKKFPDCRDIKELPFDFYLPDYNTCVEFDGKHHYEPVFEDEDFVTTLLHDNMKNNYCRWNNIRLLRIPYFKNINDELNNFLFI